MKTAADETTRTHGINMDALARPIGDNDIANEEIALEVKGLNLHYGSSQALYDVNMVIPKTANTIP